MLTNAQIKLIKSLHTKNGRDETGLCLVEGSKVIEMAKDFIKFQFNRKDTKDFDKLVTTETPQNEAAIARITKFMLADFNKLPTIVVLDGVQDPGNVGAIFRACLGFLAGLVLVDSADPANSKVIRSSVGSMFHVPWVRLDSKKCLEFLDIMQEKAVILRLENKKSFIPDLFSMLASDKPVILIAGSEGKGIRLPVSGTSLEI